MKRFAFLLLFFAFFPLAGFAGTCGLCRQTLSMGGNDGLIQGFYWSILLIAGMPMLIVVFAASYSYLMSKKLKEGSKEG